jgi:hypothetical protein
MHCLTKNSGKPGNLINLIKLPSLLQYYVNHFTPSFFGQLRDNMLDVLIAQKGQSASF